MFNIEKNNKKYSIIITTYNNKNEIEETLKSCLNQINNLETLIEILIIDDESTDNTYNLIKKWQKNFPHIIKIYQLKHSGNPANTRNLGIKKSKGDIIFFLDGDDIMTKDRIHKTLKFIENNDIDIFCSNAMFLSNDERNNKKYFKNLESHLITFEELVKNNNIIQSTIAIKKSFIKKNGLFEYKKFVHEDYDYYLRATLHKAKIYYLNLPLVLYRINPKGISQNLKILDNYKKTINTLKNNLPYTNNKYYIKLIKREIIKNKIRKIKTRLIILIKKCL